MATSFYDTLDTVPVTAADGQLVASLGRPRDRLPAECLHCGTAVTEVRGIDVRGYRTYYHLCPTCGVKILAMRGRGARNYG